MAGKNDKLTEEARRFVVSALACFDSPATVAAAVKKEFGVEIKRQSIEFYDPTKRAGANCAEKWKTLFHATRKAFIDDTAEIGISHKSVRLRSLQRMFDLAELRGNLAMMQSILKQAAEEAGGAYTNKREISGPGGKPLEFDGKVEVTFVRPGHKDQPGA